jgi:hypothetical protein
MLSRFAQRYGAKKRSKHQAQQIGLKITQHPFERNVEQRLGAVTQAWTWLRRRREAQPVHWNAVNPALFGLNVARRQPARRLRIGREHPHLIASCAPVMNFVPRAPGAVVTWLLRIGIANEQDAPWSFPVGQNHLHNDSWNGTLGMLS